MLKKILALALSFILFLLPGCAKMISFDHEGAFDLWSSMQEESLAALFVGVDENGNIVDCEEDAARVANILAALEVSKMTIEAGTASVISMKPFTSVYAQNVVITYESELFDTFSFEACANFTRIDDVWRLIWDYDLLFPTMEKTDSISYVPLQAQRGEIFTSDRVCLARNVYAPTLYVRPDAIADQDYIAGILSNICGVAKSEIIDVMRSEKAIRDGVGIIKVYSPAQDVTDVRLAIADIPGVGIDESYMSPMRVYPTGDMACLASNLVGYVGAIPEASLDDYLAKGYSPYDTVGISGLEAAYEEELRGVDGYRLQLLDTEGNVRTTLAARDALNGVDLTLTIDSQIQLAAEQALKEQLVSGQSGSLISLDPTTGAMLAMASYPTYDNNFFTLPATNEAEYQAQWEAINSEDGGYPLLFRCVHGMYTPGSTAKVLTGAAAIESGTMSGSTVFPGVLSGNTWYPQRDDWYYPGITRHSSYVEEMNMTNGLIHSDNVYFAYAAMQMGAETYVQQMTKFGFFDRVPFDLLVYNTQISSSEDRTHVENIKFLADLGYGQGEMLSTPLQMAVLYSAFANGGDIMTPYVVAHTDRTVNGQNVRISTTEPTVWKENVVSASTISTILPMMRGVVQRGTATYLDIDGMGIAGKTGTAETGVDRQHSWFIGFNTEGTENRLACVTLDVADGAGGAVQPLARVLFTAERAQVNIDDQTQAQSDTIDRDEEETEEVTTQEPSEESEESVPEDDTTQEDTQSPAEGERDPDAPMD